MAIGFILRDSVKYLEKDDVNLQYFLDEFQNQTDTEKIAAMIILMDMVIRAYYYKHAYK